LTIAPRSVSEPQIVAFEAEKNATAVHPVLSQILEFNLHSYSFFDPSSTISGDAFGFYAYSYALKQNATAPFTPSNLISAAESYFTTLYASLANTQLFTPTPTARSVTAIVTTSTTRLFVVTPIAYAIVSVLLLALVCNVFLFIYSMRTHSILTEQPAGILGWAALIVGTDVEGFVGDFRTDHVGVLQMTKYVETHYLVQKAKCFADGARRVRIEELEEKRRASV